MYRTGFLAAVGAFGGILCTALGGWDHGLQTLLLFMLADYVTGFMVAGVFHRSPKTQTGSLSSDVGLMGLCKKIVMLLLVMAAVRLDLVLGSDYLRDATLIALIGNELVSLIENAGLIGVPIPAPIKKAIDLLNEKQG